GRQSGPPSPAGASTQGDDTLTSRDDLCPSRTSRRPPTVSAKQSLRRVTSRPASPLTSASRTQPAAVRSPITPSTSGAVGRGGAVANRREDSHWIRSGGVSPGGSTTHAVQ